MTAKKTITKTETDIETVIAIDPTETLRLQFVKANAIVDAFVRHGFPVHGGIPQVLQITRPHTCNSAATRARPN